MQTINCLQSIYLKPEEIALINRDLSLIGISALWIELIFIIVTTSLQFQRHMVLYQQLLSTFHNHIQHTELKTINVGPKTKGVGSHILSGIH